MVATQVEQGLLVAQNVDWSVTTASPLTFDFATQPNSGRLEWVRGVWCDNSGNTNDVILFVPSTSQSIRVFAGEVATVPLFASSLPKIQMVNAQNGTPNVGLTNILFTSWDLGFAIAQTAGGSVVIVKDSTLNGLFGTAASGLGSIGGAVKYAQPQGVIAGMTNVAYPAILAGGTQVLWANANQGPAYWFVIQNISAAGYGGELLVGFLNSTGAFVPTVSNCFQIPAGGMLTSGQLGAIPGQKCVLGSASQTSSMIAMWQ
jgi:hypothetical protein